MFSKLVVFLSLMFSSNLFAGKITINFEDEDHYLKSLCATRSQLGSPIETLPEIGGARVNRINPANINDPHIVTLDNLFESASTASVQVVLHPTNLYIAGFLYLGTFYRFTDMSDINVAGARTETLVGVTSDYTRLQNIAGIRREDLTISHANLQHSIHTLGTALPHRRIRKEEAKAILRLITVISEALRFRNLSTRFAAEYFAYQEFSLNSRDISLTLNWGQISQYAERITSEGDIFDLDGLHIYGPSPIVSLLALALNCVNGGGETSRAILQNECPDDDYKDTSIINVRNGTSLTSYDDKDGYLYIAENDLTNLSKTHFQLKYRHDNWLNIYHPSSKHCARIWHKQYIYKDTCNTDDALWSLIFKNGAYKLMNKQYKKCLATYDNYNLDLQECNASDDSHIKWQIGPKITGDFSLKTTESYQADISYQYQVSIANIASGFNITNYYEEEFSPLLGYLAQDYPVNSDKQRFTLSASYNSASGSTEINFININTGFCMDLIQSPDNLIQMTCDDKDKKFRLLYTNTGAVMIKHIKSDFCIGESIKSNRKYSSVNCKDDLPDYIQALWRIDRY